MGEIRSSIDLGTNTCLLLVGECDGKSRVVRVIHDEARVVRLGQGVDQNRALHPDAMKRVLDCLRDYSVTVKKCGINPSKTIAVATSQARDSKNGAEFFAQVERETGFRFQVISGDEEARYTFLGGLLPTHDPNRSAVIDIGGGSTEIISITGGKSLDIGSVRFTERYLKSDPVTDAEFWACEKAIDTELATLKSWRDSEPNDLTLVGVAGTVTTLAAYHLRLEKFDARLIDGLELLRGDIHRMVEELKFRTAKERELLPGVEPGRADVLLAGSLILWRAMEVLRFEKLSVSTRGLRYGVLNIRQPSIGGED